MEKKNLVAAYCRVSTLEQKKKGYGIDIQKRDIEKYAENLGLLVDFYYLDEAKSGVSERRTALNKLVRNCKSGDVGTIIVSSLDRLSRDLRFTENLLHDLNKVGVRVFIADMPSLRQEYLNNPTYFFKTLKLLFNNKHVTSIQVHFVINKLDLP